VPLASTSPSPVTAGERLARSAGIIGMATMSSRLLGVVREQVVAYLFGASREMDAFNVAFRIPNLLRDLFAEGAMSAAFVPSFSAYLARRSLNEAWRFGSSIITVLAVVTLALAALGMVFADPIVGGVARGFADAPGTLALTVALTRVMFPFLTLVALAAAFMGMLNALQRFFVPSFAPAMFNVGAIACAIGLVPLMAGLGWPRVMALAIGTLVGGSLQAFVQYPALRRAGFRYSPAIGLTDPDVRRVFVLMGPGLIGIAGVQVNLFVNTLLATGQGEGAVSWLNYAFRLVYFPIGLFGVSVATAALPAIARSAAQGDVDEVRRMVSRGLRMMLVLNIPATAGLIVLARPIVSVLFERGAFTSADAAATAAALVAYAPGLVGYCAIKLAVPSLYSLGDSRTPTIVSLLSVAANIAVSVLLVRVLGFRGLALGTSIAALMNGALLIGALRSKLGGIDGGRVLATAAKVSAASLVMAAVSFAAARALGSESAAGQAIRVAAGVLVGLAALAGTARLLGVSELTDAASILIRRLRPAGESAAS
jgi:putative peptidoglycan lipid II flippase